MGNAIPESALEMIAASGSPGFLILLWIPVLLVLFIIGILKRKDRFSFVYLCLSFIPFFTGMIGSFSGLTAAFGQIATNPQANASDLAAGVYVGLFPNMLGSAVSLLSIFGACFLLAFSKSATEKETGNA